MYFTDPKTGKMAEISVPWTVALQFLFGPIYLMFSGLWVHALIFILLEAIGLIYKSFVILIGLWILYMALIVKIREKRYLRKGWIKHDPI